MGDQIITIESSCRSDLNRRSNNAWTTGLQTDYVMNTGDTFIAKSGFINVGSLSGSNIIFESDTTVALEFGYYLVNGLQFLDIDYTTDPNNPTYKYRVYPKFQGQNDSPVGPGYPTVINYNYDGNITNYTEPTDFGTYVAHLRTDGVLRPMTARIEVTLKAGAYSPGQLAEQITQKFSTINPNDLQVSLSPSGVFAISSGSKLLVPTTGDIFFLSGYDATTDIDTIPKFQIANPYETANPAIPSTADVEVPNYFMGTSEFALDYDPDSQSFQFSFLHTPVVNPTDGTVANAVGRLVHPNFMANSVAKVISPLFGQSRVGGIFLTKLEPTEFWEGLGFVLDDVIVDISSGIDISEVQSKTTDGQMGLSSILGIGTSLGGVIVDAAPVSTSDPPIPITPKISYLGDTNIIPLKARTPYISSNNGYYYVRATLGGILNTGQNCLNEISAIYSGYFTLNNYVNGYADSAIPYIHNGLPMTLSYIDVQILDRDKLPVKDLRDNSCIIFQIVKADSVSTPPPTSQKAKGAQKATE